MAGYAVVDTETTGLFPFEHHRVVEIAVVQVSPDGQVEDTWCTLLNPGRDLGPQQIHGIRAADVLDAPTFGQVAGDLAELLAGRAFVGHNVRFDQRFVQAEYARAGWDVPVVGPVCLCTMQWAGRLFPGTPRALGGCCEHLGIPLAEAHTALADATAAADLLRACLGAVGELRAAGLADRLPWEDVLDVAQTTPWPPIPRSGVGPRVRTSSDGAPTPYLERLAASLPQSADRVDHEEYLALLDRALLDRVLSVREQQALASVAAELSIDRATALRLHRDYLAGLAGAAWADGVVTETERADLDEVAALLSLDPGEVTAALGRARHETGEGCLAGAEAQRFALAPGDLVVFTGEMSLPRDVWCDRAREAGLVPHGNVTKKVALVVAADPDSLSGKARKAADYGIPIVTEHAFTRMLGEVGGP